MKNLEKKLETISLDLDDIIANIDAIIKTHNQKQLSKKKNYSKKLKIEHLHDLAHIITTGKNIVDFLLLESTDHDLTKKPK